MTPRPLHALQPPARGRALPAFFAPSPMKTRAPLSAFAALLPALVLAAQDPPPAAAPVVPAAPAVAGTWTEGFGRATSYRTALAMALEDAVGKAKGISIARGAGVRSRLSVVSRSEQVPKDWFDGEADHEREWVQQQLAGFVQTYEVTKRAKAADDHWEVTVRADIATHDGRSGGFVLDLVDADLRQWQLERFEEGAAGGPFAKVDGTYEAPSIRDNLRATGLVRILAKSGGVDVGAGAAPREREKAGQQLVASHRVVVTWQPMQFQSLVEKPNRARPTSGPRPQFLTGASVRVRVEITDLVQNVAVLDRPLTVALELPPATPVERLDAFAVQLADKAKAAVAEAIFFTLQPPVVARKWPGEGGADWFVEVAMSRRVAQGYDEFVVGNQGSLASPDWRPFGRAALVGGTDTSCTFRLVDVGDPSRIEAGVSEVRPGRK